VAAEKHQNLTIAGIFGALVISLTLFYSLIFGGKKTKVPLSVAKKEDISTADDPVPGNPTDLAEKVSEPVEGTVDNAESSGEIEKEEEPNLSRRRHRRET
jgi:hypothetical protein